MDVKPTLMIHAMTEDMFDLPLHQFTLTFDDGLYSQWKFFDKLLSIDTDKYFFISTKFICHDEAAQTRLVLPSKIAHEKARRGEYEDFMTADQIRNIASSPRCFIGGHGHAHLHLASIPKFLDRVRLAIEDTNIMCNEMKNVVGIMPTTFCFPYNYDMNGMYQALLRKVGITKCFGRERIPIETLLHKPYP